MGDRAALSPLERQYLARVVADRLVVVDELRRMAESQLTGEACRTKVDKLRLEADVARELLDKLKEK